MSRYVCRMSAPSERTRLAPTPSGYLHAGNAINFLLSAMMARALGAELRLRIDDLDAERIRPAFIDDIFVSLEWLGIRWATGPRDRRDHELRFSQADRVPLYLEHAALLKEQGDLYACTCSRTSLHRRPCDCRQRGLHFDRRDAAWRLHFPPDAMVRMEVMMADPVLLAPASLMPDPVIRQRPDLGGRPSYQIASLVDDAEHGTTFIVRGQDLLASTACQLYLADRLGLESFKRVRFLHHPLLTDEAGDKLSKSDGARSLKRMRAEGMGPEAIMDQARTMLAELMPGHSMP